MKMMMVSTVLYVDSFQKIEYFFDSESSNKAISFVFTPFNNRDLEGNGYGGEVFAQNCYDVIAFKTVNDDWFQSVPPEVFEMIRMLVTQKCYEFKVGYGSSMGGYAGIAFSKLLNLDLVVAYSPQFCIDETFDRRWEHALERIKFKYKIEKTTVSQQCKFIFVYDNRDLDRLHIEKILGIIPNGNVQLIKIPYAGHPVTYCLYETGEIKYIIENLRFSDIDCRRIIKKRRYSHTYFFNLSNSLLNAGKINAALRSINTAVLMDSKNLDYQKLRTTILESLIDDKVALHASFAESTPIIRQQKEKTNALVNQKYLSVVTDIHDNKLTIDEILKQLYINVHKREITDKELAEIIQSLSVDPVKTIIAMLSSNELLVNMQRRKSGL